MLRERFAPLPQVDLAGFHCELAEVAHERRVRIDSAAMDVMTDLSLIPAASIDVATAADAAHRAMQLRGVRLLLVTDSLRGVVGVVTAADFLGERPLRVANGRGIRFAEISVGQVMTAMDEMEAMRLDDVLRAEVGHVVATLRRSGRQHALVVEPMAGGRLRIRGIFSLTQISRQLGEPVPASTEVARNFAEIEAAIAV